MMSNLNSNPNRILITGGAGFIGSALSRYIINEKKDDILIVDKLTYAGNLESLQPISTNNRYGFKQADICDKDVIDKIFSDFKPNIVIHLAAESHVDRSIDSPSDFINTNIIGTYTLLECFRKLYFSLSEDERSNGRYVFHHVSTDEVYGDLEDDISLFTEDTKYSPSSPYSASKASSDHLVRAWNRTFKIPIVVTNCSNNYGPYHFPEKLIPLIILSALSGKDLPIYGEGDQIRDWLYVDDHARALYKVATAGRIGETYNIGGHNEKKNIDVVHKICEILDTIKKREDGKSYKEQIIFVKDRPGHDRRYAIDAKKIHKDLNWLPEETFETGILKTIEWYLANKDSWCKNILDGSYKLERLGI